MRNAREQIWWMALLRRILLWGAVMAFLWALPGSLLLAAPLMVKLATNDIHAGVGYLSVVKEIIIAVIVLSSCVPASLGLVAGIFSGFYVPAIEPINPFRSKFFHQVGWDTLLFFVASLFVAVPCVLFFLNFVSFNVYPIGLALPLILFSLSLWRALNRALRAAKT